MNKRETPISNSDLETKSSNRFNTVIAASIRSRELSNGHLPMVNTKSVTNNVKALEEIAEGKVDVDEYIEKLRKHKK
jgi:DNA-directed RNA polymerase omega subunit